MRVFLGIDTGTSVIKGHAIDETGHTCAHVSAAHDPVAGSNQKGVSDPEVWWREWSHLCTDLVNRLPPTAEVACIVSTAMVPNVCLLDAAGAAIAPPLLFYDDRAYDIERRLDEELRSGRWQNEVLSKLMWQRRSSGSLALEGAHFVTTHSYIALRLTGIAGDTRISNPTLDTVTAAETGSIYVPAASWNTELLARYGLGGLRMPEVVAPTSIVGTVTAEAAAETGLREGTPVVAGTSDSIASLIGAGARQEGDILVYYGTFNCAARLNASMDRVLSGGYRRYPIDWLTSVPRAGHQIRDMANMLFPGSTPYGDFDAAAATSSPGANGLIFLQDVDLLDTTVSSNPHAALLNYQIGHTAADIARAALESFAYALTVTLEDEGTPLPLLPDELLAGGGGARSGTWRQVVTDVLDRPQRYVRHSDRGHGSALLALASSDDEAFEAAMTRLLKDAEVVHPSGDGPRYVSSLSHYREALGRLREVRSW
ncbi:xylulokinase [Streptomyces europaeiscabiei]|uniref:xylulokinase n=1 Tax=Streptomyces europaeiscabiei TaxID=146819 RepID=UPI0029A98835|nr:FGGY family carbohydrate kinase [Streptomyces europaeiscabiei]MDX2759255.1 FGGY family carbohydrate kinase [Streptomyces europaeiscabiei]